MAITLNGTTGITSPGGDTSTSLATTNLSYTGTLTGGTGVINIGSGQIYKDVSGNVGIGTGTPSQRLQIQDSTANNGTVQLGGSVYYGTIKHNATVTGANEYNVAAASGGGHLFQVGGSTLMNLTASGNLGLGVTPSTTWTTSAKVLQINGFASLFGYSNTVMRMASNAVFTASNETYGISANATYYQQYGGQHTWFRSTDASPIAGNAITWNQAMTLDASGFLYLGTTTQYVGAGANFYRNATGSNQRVASFVNNGVPGTNSPAGVYIYYSAAAGGNGSTFLQCSDSTADRLYILGSGNVQNTNNSYGAISDISVKENIVDATPKLNDLLKVQIRSFNLKGETTKQIGVVAQELEEVFPGMIEENDNGLKGVKYSVFVPMLVKAIQELTTRLETLEARTA